MCVLTDGRDVRIKLSTGVSVKPSHWNPKGKYVRSADNESASKNRHIKHFSAQVLEIYLEAYDNDFIADAHYIRDTIQRAKKKNASSEFWDIWGYYLAEKRSSFKPASFKKFDSLKSHLIGFEGDSKTPWIIDSTSKQRLEGFQNWLFDNGLANQTAAKYMGIFKMFLNWCIENEYMTNSGYRAFKPIQVKDTLKVILSQEEVEAVRTVKLEGKPYLQNARSLFYLSILTGLRYSDYKRIRAEHLKKDNEGTPILQIRQQKTGDLLDIPLTPQAEQIVMSIISGTVRPISNQKMNTYVKELCKLAGINEPFEVVTFKGKMSKTVYKPKYELISTHSGRRTFATNLLLKGLPAETVMLFTGHKDYKSFSKYVNIPLTTKMRDFKRVMMG